MSIREILIPREKIPPGCHWEGGKFVWGPRLTFDNENQQFAVQASVAYYDLMDALSELVKSAVVLDAARDRHNLAINRVRAADSRSEYITDLPSPPWRLGAFVVRCSPGHDPSYIIEPLYDMEPENGNRNA